LEPKGAIVRKDDLRSRRASSTEPANQRQRVALGPSPADVITFRAKVRDLPRKDVLDPVKTRFHISQRLPVQVVQESDAEILYDAIDARLFLLSARVLRAHLSSELVHHLTWEGRYSSRSAAVVKRAARPTARRHTRNHRLNDERGT
tara:strand:+ start:164 stop:604 length:441 start_codon:yes stop_codon:yes gene_type:complete